MLRLFAASIALICGLNTAAHAGTIEYILANHPDGNVNPPPYGLRLDGLYTLNTNDEWTFDFDHASSNMRMTFNTDTSTVRIFGQAFGGLDTGSGYDADLQGLWDIDFTYSTNVSYSFSGGSNEFLDLEVNPEAPLDNNGTITALFTATDGSISVTNGDVINLEQEMEFFFNNIDDHRLSGTGLSGPDTFVGWGWLNHSDSGHINASDWLFTATVVPIPAAAWLFMSGLGALGFMRRRKQS